MGKKKSTGNRGPRAGDKTGDAVRQVLEVVPRLPRRSTLEPAREQFEDGTFVMNYLQEDEAEWYEYEMRKIKEKYNIGDHPIDQWSATIAALCYIRWLKCFSLGEVEEAAQYEVQMRYQLRELKATRAARDATVETEENICEFQTRLLEEYEAEIAREKVQRNTEKKKERQKKKPTGTGKDKK